MFFAFRRRISNKRMTTVKSDDTRKNFGAASDPIKYPCKAKLAIRIKEVVSDIKRKIRIRLARINAPEIFGDEKPHGLVSKQCVEDNFLNKDVQILDEGLDSFRRNLVEVSASYNNEDVNLNDLMVNKKLAIYETFK